MVRERRRNMPVLRACRGGLFLFVGGERSEGGINGNHSSRDNHVIYGIYGIYGICGVCGYYVSRLYFVI